MTLRLLPNVLTFFRIAAVVPIVLLLVNGRYRIALWLAFFAGLSDLLDGFLARRFGWFTHFGGLLDPIADKLLVLSTAVTLAWLGYFPWWLFALVVARDLVIVSGGVAYQRYCGTVNPEPTLLSKFNTLLLICLLLVIMLRLAGLSSVQLLEPWLIAAVAGMTVITGLQYVWIWGRRARQILAHD